MNKLRLLLFISIILLILSCIISISINYIGLFILIIVLPCIFFMLFILGATSSVSEWNDNISKYILTNKFDIWIYIIINSIVNPVIGFFQGIIYIRFNILENPKRLLWFNLISPHIWIISLPFFIGMIKYSKKLPRYVKNLIISLHILTIIYLVYYWIFIINDFATINILINTVIIYLIGHNIYLIAKIDTWSKILKPPIPSPYK